MRPLKRSVHLNNTHIFTHIFSTYQTQHLPKRAVYILMSSMHYYCYFIIIILISIYGIFLFTLVTLLLFLLSDKAKLSVCVCVCGHDVTLSLCVVCHPLTRSSESTRQILAAAALHTLNVFTVHHTKSQFLSEFHSFCGRTSL